MKECCAVFIDSHDKTWRSCGRVYFFLGCFLVLIRKRWIQKLYSTYDVTFWKLLCTLLEKKLFVSKEWWREGESKIFFPFFLFFYFRPELFPEILGLLQNLLVHSLHFCIHVFSAWWKTRLFTSGNDQWLLQASVQQRQPAAGNHLSMCFAISKEGRQKLCSLTNYGRMLMVLFVCFVLWGVY